MSNLILTVGKLELTPCCTGLMLPPKDNSHALACVDGQGNRWGYAGELEAPASHFTYDTIKMAPAHKETSEFKVDGKLERIEWARDRHSPFSEDHAYFGFVVIASGHANECHFLHFEKGHWVKRYTAPQGLDFFHLPKSHFVILVSGHGISWVDLDEGIDHPLFNVPTDKTLYKAHLSDDKRYLLIVLCDTETDRQSFWMYTFRTQTLVELKEGVNDVPDSLAKALKGVIFPINMTTGYKATGDIKSLRVVLS